MIQEVVGTQGRPLLLPVVRRRGLQQQRVPLVAAHQARGRPGAPGAGPRHARRGPRRRRLSDPVAPGQPGLRVNVTPDEIVRYAPAKIDVINIETRRFETIDAADLLARVRRGVPGVSTSSRRWTTAGSTAPSASAGTRASRASWSRSTA